MSLDPKDMVGRSRKRATASILGFAERQQWYSRLTPAEKAALRDKVLSAEAAHHDVVLDVISTLDGGGGVYNDKALELLEQIHQVLRQERPLVEMQRRSSTGTTGVLDGRS